MQQYTFTRAFGDSADNERVFKEAAESGVEEALTKGTSYLLFSYGALRLRGRKGSGPVSLPPLAHCHPHGRAPHSTHTPHTHARLPLQA